MIGNRENIFRDLVGKKNLIKFDQKHITSEQFGHWILLKPGASIQLNVNLIGICQPKEVGDYENTKLNMHNRHVTIILVDV